MARLTRSNYCGPPVHETATAKSRQYPSVPDVVVRETRRNGIMAVRPAPIENGRGSSVDIDAQPLSSTDEDEQEQKQAEHTPKTKRIQNGLKDLDNKILQRQRCLGAGKAVANPGKGDRTDIGPAMEITFSQEKEEKKSSEELSEGEAMMRSWHQHAAKKRKLPPSKTYQSARVINIHTSAGETMGEAAFQPIPAVMSPRRSGEHAASRFKALNERGAPSLSASKAPEFIMPAENNNLSPWRKTRSKFKDQGQSFKVPDEIPSSSSATARDATFKPTAESITSSTTTTDHAPTIFSHPDSPTLIRSGSPSSLSSVDSIASLLLTQDEKDELMRNNDAPEPNRTLLTAQCPLCRLPVSNADLEEFTIRFSRTSQIRLPSRLQQKFCRHHRAKTARETWHERGYPDIDWDRLASARIADHLPVMRSIIQNRKPSFYRDCLVEASTPQAGGRRGCSRRTMLKYLKEGVLDVVRYGYYGPRGAKVAAEAITSRLSAELVQAAATDVVVREAGAGGFVQAVLVPEMVGRWIAEDRGWNVEEEADWKDDVWRVLEESGEVGRLVNEDEDRVVMSNKGHLGRGGGYVVDLDEG